MSKREVKIPSFKPAKNNPKKPVTFTAPGSVYGNPPPSGEEPLGKGAICPQCGGKGWRLEMLAKVKCSLCGGSGKLLNPNRGR